MKHTEKESASTGTSSRRKRSSPESSPKGVAGRGQERILWSHWWPFDRATGEALKQLNRPQSKDVYPHDVADAPM